MNRSPLARCLEARTQQAVDAPTYSVSLAIADQPVKPSRRCLQQISVMLSRDGMPASVSDVSVGFHPLHQAASRGFVPGELVLAPHHDSQSSPQQFEGSISLQTGDYEVDVTIDHRLHASFVVHM